MVTCDGEDKAGIPLYFGRVGLWFVIAWIRFPGISLYHIHPTANLTFHIGMLQEETLLKTLMVVLMSSVYGLHLSEIIGTPLQPPTHTKVSIHVIGTKFHTQTYLFLLIWIRRYLLAWLYLPRSPHHTAHIPKLTLMILSVEDATRGLHYYCVVFELSFLIVVENSTTIYKTVIRFCCVYQTLSHLNTSCTITYIVFQTPSYILSNTHTTHSQNRGCGPNWAY